MNSKQAKHEIELLLQVLQADNKAEVIAGKILQRIRDVVPCQFASISAVDLDIDELTVLAVQDSDQPGPDKTFTFTLSEIPGLEHLREGEIYADGEQPVKSLREQFGKFFPQTSDLQAFIVAPLVSQGELSGILNLGARKVNTFTAAHLTFVKQMTPQLAAVIQKAQANARSAKQLSELRKQVAETSAEWRKANSELDAYAYTISHDLGAPLRAVLGFLEEIENNGSQLNRESCKNLERIKMATRRMDTMIQNLLTYSRCRRDVFKLHPLHLGLVVAEACDSLKTLINEKNAEIAIENPLPRKVLGHHTTLVQAVSHLLSNAVKFVAPDVQPRIRVWAEELDDKVRLWIEDNGMGIAPENQDRIFGLFERVNSSYSGAGIGLAIVQKAVMRMQGNVALESQPGKGSKFRIELKKSNNA